MGLFSRKEAKSSRQATQRPRPSVSSEAQAASLRVRARRRLAGAVALVLAAVIILPMLLDGDPRPVPAGIEVVVPERNAPFNPELGAPPAVDSATLADMPEGSMSSDLANGSTVSMGETAESATDDQAVGSDANQTAQVSETPTTPQTTESAATETKPAEQPKAQSTAQTSQADSSDSSNSSDGSDNTALAMAILEGRTPAPAAASGQYVLQIASYGSQPDAQARVEKLKSQGVSNAFIENATVNDKPTFRLRVGPFDSRSAAQAAQARLRTLGYDNGFITAK